MQSVPCGWINPTALLVLGKGMLVDFDQLDREVRLIRGTTGEDIRQRLIIDGGAMVLDGRHRQEEGGVDGTLHHRIGSTGKGVGAARRARMNRDPSQIRSVFNTVDAWPDYRRCVVPDTVRHIQAAVSTGENLLLEGTQGSGLSLIHGPWPYVTSHDTNAAQLAADVGIPPHWVSQVVLVARTFPIRVAGNSGPLKYELTWDEISERVGKETVEKTTVTQKTRRIGEWDSELFMSAVRLNRPTSVAVSFIDYWHAEDEGKQHYDQLSYKSQLFIEDVSVMANAPVQLIGTGGPNWTVIDRGGVL